MRTLALLLLLLASSILPGKTSDLSVYQKESYPASNGDFIHLAFDSSAGRVYIGAVNNLYQLDDGSLKLQQNSITGPEPDNPNCRHPDNDALDCTEARVLTSNYNKILAVDSAGGTLITCGSLYQGVCQARNLENITLIDRENVENFVAANSLSHSTVGYVSSSSGSNVLYVGATYTGFADPFRSVPPVVSRNLEDFAELPSFASISFNPANFIVDYIGGFVHSNESTTHSYFTTVQRREPSSDLYFSKLVRICQNSVDDNIYNSYTEVPLTCGDYNIVRDIYLTGVGAELSEALGIANSEKVLFGVFSKGATNSLNNGYEIGSDSALCFFPMRDVEKKFSDAIDSCARDNKKSLGYVNGAKCYNSETVPVDGCRTYGLYLYIDSEEAITAAKTYPFPGTKLSSVAVTKIEEYTVAFVGRTDGYLMKVYIGNSPSSEYESFLIDLSGILPDMEFSPAQEEIFVMTPQKLVKLDVDECSQYESCDACMGAKDPYCGWCTLEKKCSRKVECQLSDQENRWLAFDQEQCVEFTDIKPAFSLHRTIGSQELYLTVARLPELQADQTYTCVFDLPAAYESPAVQLANGTEFTCVSPPQQQIPDSDPNSDNVAVTLSLKSSETGINFVSTQFYYYQCNFHESCSQCVNSGWICDWCIYENKCTNDVLSECTVSNEIVLAANRTEEDGKKGHTYCPQIIENPKILISNGVPSGFSLSGQNLPNVDDYECVIRVENQDPKRVAGRLVSNNTIDCAEAVYIYESEEQELLAPVKVEWNSGSVLDDLYSNHLTLYKCSVGRSDCSQCLGAGLELKCGWCQEDSCTVEESCADPAAWWSTTKNVNNCPGPEVQKISPISGPLEGGTSVLIEGKNLGVEVSRILKVEVAGHACQIIAGSYEPGKSLSCKTSSTGTVPKEGAVTVTVRGNDDTEQQSEENSITFYYKDPRIIDFTPKLGPMAGGTLINVTGEDLDIGSNLSSEIAGSPCHIVSGTTTSATSFQCTTTNVSTSQIVPITLVIDNAQKNSVLQYNYTNNPNITQITPMKSFLSGGRTIMVTGNYLNSIQKPEFLVTTFGVPYSVVKRDTEIEQNIFTSPCQVNSFDTMECQTPNISGLKIDPETAKKEGFQDAVTGFKMDNVLDLLELSKTYPEFTFTFFIDPMFKAFEEDNKEKTYNGGQLIIMGENLNLAASEEEVDITIGGQRCNVTSLDTDQVSCEPPDLGSGKNYEVKVTVGNLVFNIGLLKYPSDQLSLPYIIGPIAAVLGILILVIIIIAIVFCRKSKASKRRLKKLEGQFDNLEMDVRNECKIAFTELQTDMTDFTRDLEGSGVPLLPFKQYGMNILFPGLDTHPIIQETMNGVGEHQQRGLKKFLLLLSNKDFLTTFIHTLEEQKNFTVRDKQNVASLLTVIFICDNKSAYLTEILKLLLAEHIEKAVSENRSRLMLRRTEWVYEKLLGNWLSLSLYDFLKTSGGKPIFLLCKAIKCQTDKGPVDEVTGLARYSLSEMALLKEQVEHKILNIRLLTSDEDGHLVPAKVLDVDTISQVKDKLLDVLYKNTPYSLRPKISEVDLEWRHGVNGHLILRDEDMTTLAESHGWKKINTLLHYNVPDDSILALVPSISKAHSTTRSHASSTVLGDGEESEAQSLANDRRHHASAASVSLLELEGGTRVYHLSKSEDMNESSKSKRRLTRGKTERDNVISEIYLTRLLSTKGTIQKFVNDMFRTLLTAENGMVSPPIKYIFDLLETQANRNNITDPDVTHIWKSNSLPLRFWVQIIKRPYYAFDIYLPSTVESSLGVIGQAFIESFSKEELKLGKESAANKLLYAREVHQYKEMVDTYYSDIKRMQVVSDEEINAFLEENFKDYIGIFNKINALKELYEFAKKYNDQLLEALHNNEFCKRQSAPYRLEQVAEAMDCSEI